MKIKEINHEHYDQMAAIMQSAYAGSYQGTPEEKERMTKIFLELTTKGGILALGAYEGDTMMGCVLHYVFDTNFHGEMVKSAGIGSLAVDLLHKKKHVAQQLIKESFDRSKKEGIPLYYLYPFSTEFYKNFGFGYGVPMYTYCVRPEDFIVQGNKDLLSYASEEDIELIIKFYDEEAKKTHGMSLKTYGDKRRFEILKTGKILVAKDQGELIGYMVMMQKSLNPADNQSQKIVVNEMLYKNKTALTAFTSFFSSQKDQVNYIELATFDQHFHQLLKNTYFAPKPQTLDIISLKVADKSLGLMPYALDAQGLLDKLSHKTSGNICFNIHYPKQKTATVSLVNDGQLITIDLSINAFSSWITGVINLNDLYHHGQLETANPEMLKKLDYEFYLDKPKSYTRY